MNDIIAIIGAKQIIVPICVTLFINKPSISYWADHRNSKTHFFIYEHDSNGYMDRKFIIKDLLTLLLVKYYNLWLCHMG